MICRDVLLAVKRITQYFLRRLIPLLATNPSRSTNMIYNNILTGRFIDRPNRFIAHIEIDGTVEVCHVKNTGRCRELLTEGATVYVQRSENPQRLTKFDLIAVEKGERLINMDSQIPNRVFAEWAETSGYFGKATLRPETTYKNSRFDFYIEAGERKIFVEVKGVTLEEDGVVRFPDAPTERGVKHLKELAAARAEGYEAYVFFVIQMEDCRYFTPNRDTHPIFADELRLAQAAGVEVVALNCKVTPDSITAKEFVPVHL